MWAGLHSFMDFVELTTMCCDVEGRCTHGRWTRAIAWTGFIGLNALVYGDPQNVSYVTVAGSSNLSWGWIYMPGWAPPLPVCRLPQQHLSISDVQVHREARLFRVVVPSRTGGIQIVYWWWFSWMYSRLHDIIDRHFPCTLTDRVLILRWNFCSERF